MTTSTTIFVLVISNLVTWAIVHVFLHAKLRLLFCFFVLVNFYSLIVCYMCVPCVRFYNKYNVVVGTLCSVAWWVLEISEVLSCVRCRWPLPSSASYHFVFLRTAIWLRYQVASGGVRDGLGGSPKCRLAPHRETYWSRIRMWIIRNLQILIVSAVKIYNVYKLLRLLGDFIPRPPTGGSPLNSSPLEMKIPGAASASSKVWSLSWRHLVACLPFLQTKSQCKDQDQSMLQCQLRDRPNN